MPQTMPPFVEIDASATPFDGLVVVPMLKGRYPGLLDNYGYLVRSGDRVATIDAARAEPILNAARSLSWTITDVLLTHHHPDHVDGVEGLRSVTEATIWGAAADAHRLPAVDRALSPGDAVEIGTATGTVWDVPGHTVGHVAYVFDGIAFTGDSLMSAGCGRLFEGSPEQMHASLIRFAELDGATLIASGHEYTVANLSFAQTLEPENAALTFRRDDVEAGLSQGRPSVPSTLDLERSTNPFLRCHLPALKAATGTGGQSDTATFAAARAAKDAF